MELLQEGILNRPLLPARPARRDGETPGQQPERWRTNISGGERAVSILAGATLAAAGLGRRGPLGAVAAALGGALMVRGALGHSTAYRALGIDPLHHGRAEPVDYFERGIQVKRAVTINAEPAQLYAFWRDLTNLPRIMSHLQSVEVIDDLRSHWLARGIGRARVAWDAEIINDEKNELIAWKSLEGADVDNTGSVRFVAAPAGRGTRLKVNLEYIPRGGRIAALLAKVFGGDPGGQIAEDLRRFKMVTETGEIATTDAQPRGACGGRSTQRHG